MFKRKNNNAEDLVPCFVCGYFVFERSERGMFFICPICGWEDVPSPEQFLDKPYSSNGVSIIEARKNFIMFNASDQRSLPFTRKITSSDKQYPNWESIVDKNSIPEI